MKRNSLFVSIIVLGMILSLCQPYLAIAEEEPQLATVKAKTQLSNQPGRAIVSARGNHFVVDSVPPLNGPNEELNPLDMVLGALGTCGMFLYEKVPEEMGFSLTDIVATVQADFDPRGVKGEAVNPRLQAMRVHFDLAGSDGGPTKEQTDALAEIYRTRCPIYTTLSRAVPIEITTNDEKMSGPVAEGLATATVKMQMSNQPGRAIVSARGNHFVIDSVPPLDGPNEERNPLDLMLGALGTCGSFVYEAAAKEMGIPLSSIVTHVEGDLDPRGVKGFPINPRLRAFRVNMELMGVDQSQVDKLLEEFQTRCPIFTTFVRSAPIDVTTILK